MFRTILLPAIALLTFSGLHGQISKTAESESEPFAFGVVERIQSEELGEERVLNILPPVGYHPDSATRYPVIYLLDGSVGEDFAHIAGLVEFLSTYGIMPPSFVVGIANVDRQRDFTYKPSPEFTSPDAIFGRKMEFPTAGGSAQFIAFIEKEAIPFVETHYRTSERKTLIGQSLGGLLATEIFTKKPELFTEYMIVSPSLWWDNESLIPELETTLKTRPELTQKVYISVGKEHPIMNRDVNTVVKLFKKYAPKGVEWHYEPLFKEDHATILHRTVYRGIEVLNPKEAEK